MTRLLNPLAIQLLILLLLIAPVSAQPDAFTLAPTPAPIDSSVILAVLAIVVPVTVLFVLPLITFLLNRRDTLAALQNKAIAEVTAQQASVNTELATVRTDLHSADIKLTQQENKLTRQEERIAAQDEKIKEQKAQLAEAKTETTDYRGKWELALGEIRGCRVVAEKASSDLQDAFRRIDSLETELRRLGGLSEQEGNGKRIEQVIEDAKTLTDAPPSVDKKE